METTEPTLNQKALLLEEDLYPTFVGPIEEVIARLEDLKKRYAQDYSNLTLVETSDELGMSTLQLQGERSYSEETNLKLVQLGALISSLPREAVQFLLSKVTL